VTLKVQSWNGAQAMVGGVPPAFGAAEARQEWLQEKRMGSKQPLRSSFHRTESHFSLLHAASAPGDQLDGVTFVSYVLHHVVIVTGAAVAWKEFSLQCLMLISGVFSLPRRQLDKLFISMLPNHGQELLDV